MFSNQLTNKTIALFGTSITNSVFINFLNELDIKVIILDSCENKNIFKKEDFVSYSTRDNVDWNNISCLVVSQDDKCLFDIAEQKNCRILSIIDFFTKYFNKYKYIGLIGESGSSMTFDILKYILCKVKLKIDIDVCDKNSFFTLSEFGKTDSYIYEIRQKNFSYIQSPYFNYVIIFDLDYNKNDIQKIKNIVLNQTDNDFTILNIDDEDIKDFYIKIKDDISYKSKIIPISVKKILRDGISFINNEIYININDKNDEILTQEFKDLNGEQNKINILASFALLSQYNDIQQQEIIENIYNFKPCDNIFETVLHNENFTFINDINNVNKLQSLLSFDNIYWILCIDEIDFEFNCFLELVEYLNKVKYVFLVGKYNEEILQIFRENEIKYFIMYDMNSVFKKINEFFEKEKKEEKITILLSSINNLENSDFYSKCSNDFEKLVNKEK